MCGISGIFDFGGNAVDASLLARMTARMRHRGPDGEGILVDREMGMGHRRLSIIDVEGGAQPIHNEDGNVSVVFNGEIYNFIELRKELEQLGHHFATRSDTEVIVHAYEQWGEYCVKRFNGMFAFAIWDRRTRQLFLARDHLGVKPLYHTRIGNTFYFASEIKALLENPECPREVDEEALAQLLSYRAVPSPKTLFRGIMKLSPASWLRCGAKGVEFGQFWNQSPTIRNSCREEELIEEYQRLLRSAVQRQLRSDVPLGLFLSSGVDSGVLLALMSEEIGGAVQAFTIGFKGGEDTNEVDDAASLARRFGAEHHVMNVGADDYQNYYTRYMEDLEEPVAHEPAAAFYCVAHLARKHVKVALSGQGADEPWAGYDRYVGVKYSEVYSRLPSFITHSLVPFLASVPGRKERFRRGAESLAEKDVLTRFARVYSFFNAEMKFRMCSSPVRKYFGEDGFRTKDAIRGLQERVGHLDPLSQMLYIDTRTSLPDDLLMVGDKTSMANSLEVRVPFLDVTLVEFIESLPSNFKLRRLTGKYLHKKALLKWLPKNVVYRKKKGFAHPIAEWLRTSMRPLVEDCLLGPRSMAARFFDQAYIRDMLDSDRNGRANYMRQIYLLLSLELWYRAFIRK